MNRSKRAMPTNMRKKMQKAVRDTQTGSPNIESRFKDNDAAAQDLAKLYPKKNLNEQSLSRIKKNIHIKKIQNKKNTSKRTTPGEVDDQSPPAFPHREGKRWMKTIIKQNLTKRIKNRGGRKK